MKTENRHRIDYWRFHDGNRPNRLLRRKKLRLTDGKMVTLGSISDEGAVFFLLSDQAGCEVRIDLVPEAEAKGLHAEKVKMTAHSILQVRRYGLCCRQF